MKKISSPHKNLYVPKDEPIKPSDITIEDLRNFKKELDEECIKQGRGVVVTEYSETHYQLRGSVFGIVSKKVWNDALMKAAGIEPNP